MTAAIAWLTPWYEVDDDEIRAGLERQLRLELSHRHVLYGQSARLIARRCDTDDALFALRDGRVAEVHLTWSPHTEQDPSWPATAVFGSLEEWAGDAMVPLHEELRTLR